MGLTLPTHGLSLIQPWASLIAYSAKHIETRSFNTNYRGPVAIHASKGFPGWAKRTCEARVFLKHLRQNYSDHFYVDTVVKSLPLGAIVAISEILDCQPTPGLTIPVDWTPAVDSDEAHFGDYTAGRFMWRLGEVIKLSEPIPCTGALGFWQIPEDIRQRIQDSLNGSL